MSLPTPVGRQRDVLYLPTSGHFVVLGTAGSGKTTLAVLRAAYLGDPATVGGGRTLLVTFNRALVAYLKHLQDSSFRNITVENYHRFARGYLASHSLIGNNTICGPDLRAKLIRRVLSQLAGRNAPPVAAKGAPFFEAEIEWIERHGLESVDDYRNAERVGRATPLDGKSREFVYGVYEGYLAARKAALKQYDWDDLACAVRQQLDSDKLPRRYKHIIIDEGQDFSPQMVKSLAKAIPADGSLTLFADMAQQIYGRRISWKSAGLKIGRVWEFKENYRNTRQIAALGLAISRMPYFKDTPDLVEPVEPKADGPLPALVQCSSIRKELELVRDQAARGSKNQTIAVLYRRRELEDLVVKHLPKGAVRLHRNLTTWQASSAVYYGTFHAAKGLEFDTVLLPFLTTSHLPDPGDVEAFGVDEANSGDGKLLYVGVTRAKTRLIMSYTGTPTGLLPGDVRLYQAQAI